MKGFCQKYGLKLPLLLRMIFCGKWEKERKAQLARIEREFLDTKELKDYQIEFLKAQDKKTQVKFYFNVYNLFLSDKELSEEEIDALQKLQKTINLTDREARFNELIRPYIYVNSIRKRGTLPEIDLKIIGTSPVILKRGEVVHFADNAILKELRSVSMGYSGGSHGISFRIAKGVYYRVGAHKGHIVKEDRLVETSRGVLLITSKRLFLHPYPGHKPVSINLNKILSYNCFENGIEVYKEGRQRGYFFAISDPGSVEIFGLCLAHLLGNNE